MALYRTATTDRTNERRGRETERERERERERGERRGEERRGEAAEFLAYRGANWLASDLRYCKPMRRRRPCPPPEPQSNSGDFDLQCQRHVVPTVTLFASLLLPREGGTNPLPFAALWTSSSSSSSSSLPLFLPLMFSRKDAGKQSLFSLFFFFFFLLSNSIAHVRFRRIFNADRA